MQLICRLLGLLGISLLLGTALPAQNRVEDPGVQRRMTTMQTARDAVNSLAAMMANQMMFRKSHARTAKRELVKATSEIPDVFRKRHIDPLSNAKTSIWGNWSDFEARAKAANKAAKELNARSLNGLRKTLPELMHTCLACHKTYRTPRKMVITH
ncbi:MAG: cytochrome c [Rhodobacteraceae bacterium]|nr:cytochrome c [Paracoccaceae bacterium]